MYYDTQTQTFNHPHSEVARETNSSFAVGELVVGDYRLYEMAAEPAYNPTRSASSLPPRRLSERGRRGCVGGWWWR